MLMRWPSDGQSGKTPRGLFAPASLRFSPPSSQTTSAFVNLGTGRTDNGQLGLHCSDTAEVRSTRDFSSAETIENALLIGPVL